MPVPSPRGTIPGPPPAALRRLVALARPEARLLAAGTCGLLVAAGATLLFPQAFRVVIDGALGVGAPGLLGPPGPAIVDRAAVAMAAIAAIQGAAIAVRYACFSLAGERAVTRLRQDLYRAVLDQEVAFFDERRTGELTSRLASDTATVQSAVSANVSLALRHLASMLGAIGFLLFTSPRLTLLMLAVVPPVAVGGVAYGRRVRRLAREVQDALAAAGEVAEETISGIRTVRAFDAEEREVARYGAAVSRALAVARRRVLAGAAFLAGASTGGYLAAALVLWYGGRLVAGGALTAGSLTSFLVYTLVVAMSAGALADLWAEVMKAAGAAERIFEIQDRVPRVPAGGATLPRVAGAIAWERVEFAYPARPDVPVLRGVDLAVAPGEVVALVGASGGGKSTLAALLSRLYDPQRGAVRLDGHDLRTLDPRWLRRQLGVVSQEPILFSGTVAENVRYGRPGATQAEVEAAARAANAHDFVARFPEGYATRVGERGVQLSGGQKQRVAIARALLADPRILVLDEATSALDAESEHLVQEALERLMRGRTTLVIAHRLSTVVGADRVVVVQAGRVVQLGTHAALMAEDGPYRRLVERQFVAA
jgi:ABC transporter fused permease/ATP-binding protein